MPQERKKKERSKNSSEETKAAAGSPKRNWQNGGERVTLESETLTRGGGKWARLLPFSPGKKSKKEDRAMPISIPKRKRCKENEPRGGRKKHAYDEV